MVGLRDRSAGNLLFYEYLATKRAPIFLTRNIRRYLEVDEHLRIHGHTEDFQGSDHGSRQDWEPPSLDMLDDMVARARLHGSFVLDLHRLVPMSKINAATVGSTRKRTNKTRVILQVKCKIHVTIVQQSKISQLQYSSPGYEATLQGVDKNHDREISISMERIIISPDDFASTRGSLDPKQKFRLVMSLNFTSQNDAKAVYSYMSLMHTPATTTRLEARHANILDLDLRRTTLRITDAANQSILGLDVSLGCLNTAKESILAAINPHTRTGHHRRLRKPPDKPQRYRVTYVWPNDGGKEIVVPGLSCFQHTMEEKDHIYLQMHLFSMHPHHRYIFHDEGIDSQGVHQYTIECPLDDCTTDERASDRADDPRDVIVVAPDEPCDPEKILQGDDRWLRLARQPKRIKQKGSKTVTTVHAILPAEPRRKLPHEVPARTAKQRKTYVVPKAPAGVTFFRSITKRPLKAGEEVSESDDEMDEEWLRLRKYAEIEKEPVSGQAKLFLKEFDIFIRDENLESDLHLGDALVRFSREKGPWFWTATGVFEEFQVKLDQLLQDDLISHEVHTGCIKIVNSHKPPDQAHELSQKLTELNVHTATAASPTPPPTHDRTTRHKRRKGKAVITHNGQLTPLTADSDGDVMMRETTLQTNLQPHPHPTQEDEDADPPYDMCYCGQDALSSSNTAATMACSCIDCVRRNFHVACVQKKHAEQPSAKQPSAPFDAKQRNWTCDECKRFFRTGT